MLRKKILSFEFVKVLLVISVYPVHSVFYYQQLPLPQSFQRQFAHPHHFNIQPAPLPRRHIRQSNLYSNAQPPPPLLLPQRLTHGSNYNLKIQPTPESRKIRQSNFYYSSTQPTPPPRQIQQSSYYYSNVQPTPPPRQIQQPNYLVSTHSAPPPRQIRKPNYLLSAQSLPPPIQRQPNYLLNIQPSPQPQQIRQPNYLLNTQRYVAVPGQVLQHFNTASVPFTTVPAVGNVQFPLISPPLLQSFYELESDPSSSNPDGNPDSNEDNGGGLEPPPPEGQPAQPPDGEPERPPPPESKPAQPPEGEPEQPPPMMSTMAPPPPPPGDDDSRPPPHHHYGKVVHKHISIHAPPDDLESDNDQVTVIRPKIPGPSSHVNIIFIKAPSTKSGEKNTEVILPEAPEQKTIVYVLVKKPDPTKDGSIKVRGPEPTKPPKPQVYFIKYKQVAAEKNRNSYHY